MEQARKRGKARPEIDPNEVAPLIVASLEGALMMSRLQRKDGSVKTSRCGAFNPISTDISKTRRPLRNE